MKLAVGVMSVAVLLVCGLVMGQAAKPEPGSTAAKARMRNAAKPTRAIYDAIPAKTRPAKGKTDTRLESQVRAEWLEANVKGWPIRFDGTVVDVGGADAGGAVTVSGETRVAGPQGDTLDIKCSATFNADANKTILAELRKGDRFQLVGELTTASARRHLVSTVVDLSVHLKDCELLSRIAAKPDAKTNKRTR